MPKQEVGSTKWLGNKMKAKGLQKLRWYCQMCQKQCRDENGFKCHRMSDGHQRQMQLFVQDPNRFMDDFSQEFQEGFMQLMSHSYRSTRVLANTVYCDFISNRHHTHMNSTIWVTLSNFVQYLGRTNQCKIDKTPKGWYIQYIDNSPEARLRAQLKQEMEQSELSEQQRHELMLKRQIQEAKAEGGFQESEFTELQRQEGDAPITFSLTGSSAASSSTAPAPQQARAGSRGPPEGARPDSNVLAQAFESHAGAKGHKESKEKKLSALESIRLENEAKKRKLEVNPASDDRTSPSSEGPEPWVAVGLVVKVMHQDLAGGKYYRKKGVIEKVRDSYIADIRMIDSRDLIRLDQEMVETVVPNIGKPVRIVKGKYKGQRATMRNVNFEGFCVSVELDNGVDIDDLGYDHVCKFED